MLLTSRRRHTRLQGDWSSDVCSSDLIFTKRGITISVGMISGAVSAHAVQAAPVSLAASVTLAAVKGTAVTTSTLTLVRSEERRVGKERTSLRSTYESVNRRNMTPLNI